MSNAQVGVVYQQIIAEVVDASRVDFEEGGVDEAVLNHLKEIWQLKLSHLGVATFPWDPKPQETIPNPPTVPSNAYQNQAAQFNNQPPARPSNFPEEYATNASPIIKPEPGLEAPRVTAPLLTHHSAAERAAAHLQNNYGQRAMSSISAIQANLSGQPQQQHSAQAQQPAQHIQQPQQAQAQSPLQQMHPPQQQMPGMYQQSMQMSQMPSQMSQMPMQHMQQRTGPQGQAQGQAARTPANQEAYRKAMVQQAQQQQHRLQAQNGLNGAQTDGAGEDWGESFAVIKRFDSEGAEVMGRVEIDGLIRDKIAAMGQSMEGGGLMLALREASNAKKRQRKVKKSVSTAGQLDGVDSDDDKPGSDDGGKRTLKFEKGEIEIEELDNDAINSDLDDPEDFANDDDEDDDSLGNIMLCMYDKVQRVKNKWKCVMKDGVLTVDRKEYVFHKASGEYEW